MLNRSKHIDCRQSGFTLVEIAIVLVIIGLLIGGILKGQNMIESAKVKALAKDFDSVITALNAYQDKYRALPGDDAAAAAHVGGTPAAAASLGNGLIDTLTWIGNATAATDTDESALFWEHVRLAGLMTGSSAVGQATNAVGGKLGITTNVKRVTTPVGSSGTYFVCSSGIGGKLAKQLDAAVDDGDATTGNMFAKDEAAGVAIIVATAAAAYDDTKSFTVCRAY